MPWWDCFFPRATVGQDARCATLPWSFETLPVTRSLDLAVVVPSGISLATCHKRFHPGANDGERPNPQCPDAPHPIADQTTRYRAPNPCLCSRGKGKPCQTTRD